jgi:hypothetical protein
MESIVSLPSALSLGVLLVFLFYNRARKIIPSRLDVRRAPRSQEGLVCVHGSDLYNHTEGVEYVPLETGTCPC